MDSKLEGKVCLLTGGTQGIGKSFAKALAKEGVNLSIVSRHKNHEVLSELKKQIIEFTEGKRKKFSIKLNIEGTILQKKIWKQLINVK